MPAWLDPVDPVSPGTQDARARLAVTDDGGASGGAAGDEHVDQVLAVLDLRCRRGGVLRLEPGRRPSRRGPGRALDRRDHVAAAAPAAAASRARRLCGAVISIDMARLRDCAGGFGLASGSARSPATGVWTARHCLPPAREDPARGRRRPEAKGLRRALRRARLRARRRLGGRDSVRRHGCTRSRTIEQGHDPASTSSAPRRWPPCCVMRRARRGPRADHGLGRAWYRRRGGPWPGPRSAARRPTPVSTSTRSRSWTGCAPTSPSGRTPS